MTRVKIDLPQTWLFSVDLPVRITDINYGNHLGNDALVGLLQEARVRWLNQFGWTELIEGAIGLIQIEVTVVTARSIGPRLHRRQRQPQTRTQQQNDSTATLDHRQLQLRESPQLRNSIARWAIHRSGLLSVDFAIG